MGEMTTRVLLIEDSPDDAMLIQEELAEVRGVPFNLERVDRLSEGLEHLDQGGIDVVLLDLSLPDSQGLDSLARILDQRPDVPVVVLTGLEDEGLALEAVRRGSQDYLVKGQVGGPLLERSIRYAIERRRLLVEIDRRQRELEVRSLEQMSSPVSSDVASQAAGAIQLREALPQSFEELVQRYGHLLHVVLEEEGAKEEYSISGELSAIGEQLGTLNVGPGDVVAIHTEAFKRKLREVNHQKAQAYMHEGRLMVIELLGKLVSFYRDRSMGIGTTSRTPGNS